MAVPGSVPVMHWDGTAVVVWLSLLSFHGLVVSFLLWRRLRPAGRTDDISAPSDRPADGEGDKPEVDLVSADSVRIAAALERAMRWEKLYREDLTLPELARRVGEPRYRISQILNHGFGASFYDYLNRYRIDEARSLLRADADRKIEDIAVAVGFRSRASFHRAFRRVTGQTPSGFRRSKSGSAGD